MINVYIVSVALCTVKDCMWDAIDRVPSHRGALWNIL